MSVFTNSVVVVDEAGHQMPPPAVASGVTNFVAVDSQEEWFRSDETNPADDMPGVLVVSQPNQPWGLKLKLAVGCTLALVAASATGSVETAQGRGSSAGVGIDVSNFHLMAHLYPGIYRVAGPELAEPTFNFRGIVFGVPAGVKKIPGGPPNSSDTDYDELALRDPGALLKLISDGTLRVSRLTYAAEALRLVADSAAARKTLLTLLDHPSRVVREGAIYGLATHLNDAVVVARLRHVAINDSSEGVRWVASDLLDGAIG